MITTGVLGAFAFAAPGLWGPLVGLVLLQLFLILDCSDGEVARFNRTEGAVGVYADRVGHYLIDAALFTAFGLRVANATEPYWLAVGMGTAILALIAKAESDLVDTARSRTGLGAYPDTEPSADRTIARLRIIAAKIPLHRLLNAVEASIVFFVVAAIDTSKTTATWSQTTLALYALLAIIVVIGHFLAVVGSDRLTRQ
jgi:phosphatidylglycerophosphate synthase